MRFPTLCRGERALSRSATGVDRGGRHLRFLPSFSFCAIIAQTPPFFLSDLPDESVIVIFDCAQDGAMRSNKSAIMLSETEGRRFSAGKQLSVDKDEHGNKLEKAAEIA
jgi:hypothetical protein